VRVTAKAPLRIDFAGGWTDVGIFAALHTGCVVNAAISRVVTGELVSDASGMRVLYQTDVPSGSGLGTSAAMNVVLFGLLTRPEPEERMHIAEAAYEFEQVLGVTGGKQDQYAAALGGFNCMHFAGSVEAERLEPGRGFVEKLRSRTVLCWTGESRVSGKIHDRVWEAYGAGDALTVRALFELKGLAQEAREVLLKGDIDALGAVVRSNWENQKRLHESVTNPKVDALFEVAASAGAIGGKACGAGGGGCLVFICNEGKAGDVASALESAGAEPLEFDFDFDGLVVECEGD
jgi:D-glycero-alpha-D-manno-heptose-7-phosphate kinase